MYYVLTVIGRGREQNEIRDQRSEIRGQQLAASRLAAMSSASSSRDEAASGSANNSASSPSFIAGISLPPNANSSNDDAATLLQISRPDGYDFAIIPLPWFPAKQLSSDVSYLSATSSSLLPRRDVTNLDSKW